MHGSRTQQEELLQLWKSTFSDNSGTKEFEHWLSFTSGFPYFHETEDGGVRSREAEAELFKTMLQDADSQEKREQVLGHFRTRLQFGTAGIRGPMGLGFNRINLVTVIQTSQGVCSYIMKHFTKSDWNARGVVIAFDGRFNSRRFGHATAAVFQSKGFSVYLCDGAPTATPLLAYGVTKKHCLAGIMITASHNPMQDNGYKLYADNGAQIISPADGLITEQILRNLELWEGVAELLSSDSCYLKQPVKESSFEECPGAVTDPLTWLRKHYVKDICADLKPHREVTSKSPLKVVYTAMHGVGAQLMAELLEAFGFSSSRLVPVEPQRSPDPRLPTVKYPNPEEHGALDLAIATANASGCNIIIANDPDADRLACAERRPDDGSWYVFKGDEVGVLLGDYLLKRHPVFGTDRQGELLLTTTTVSSRMLQKIAEVHGTLYSETMTGFKWIMNEVLRRTQGTPGEAAVPVFAYEEALGYAVSMCVRDKDGISAAAVWIEMACQLYSAGKTLADQLAKLREQYGYFVNHNSYYLCYDQATLKTIFDEFRNNQQYKWQLGEFPIANIRDVTAGFDSSRSDRKCTFPLTPSCQMVTLSLENGCVITLRASGTEPKLKFYAEMSGSDATKAKRELERVVDVLVAEFLQPEKYRLIPPR